MAEPISNNALQSDELQYGSINDITQRLLLWGKRTGMGLLRVEFSSEFARQEVLQQLQSELAQLKVPFKDIVLPTYQQPNALASALEQALDECESGVVSISGFATAFSPNVPLAEAMYSLNIRRERLAQRPLRQIWWMTPVFYQTALHAMPDLMSWFSLRLELTELVKVEKILKNESLFQNSLESAINIDDARRRAFYLIQRFEQAQQAGGDGEELLKYYLLPALEALARVNAQKDLRDLTSQFEGYLSLLKISDSPILANSLERIGMLYHKQGRYLEAEPFLQKALTLRQNLLGEDHPAVWYSLNNLASLYAVQGRYSEAEPLYRRALDTRRHSLGDHHLDIATSLNNLANLYASQFQYAEAESLFHEALDLRQHLLGENHIDIATSLNNLAVIYSQQGRYSEAENLYSKSLKIRQQILGENHPEVANSLNNLASLYIVQNRYTEAESLHKKALDLRRELLGEDHPEVAQSLYNLANIYQRQGQYCDAESLCVQALESQQRLLGEDHPDVLKSLGLLEILHKKYNV